MRALYNPTRMGVIKIAALKLMETIKSKCPNCKTPGFSVTDIKQGIPCSWCAASTRSTMSFIYSCKKYSFNSEKNVSPSKKQPKNQDFSIPVTLKI
ncbi:DUF6671 family protein [Flavobacterium sp. W20_MBD1_R3]|uniref:DUF6671 family protein n=1 Tax=Flavobacterium sp. W20_MBD1_R3 TaxID=3240278 RepID=UPI003F8DC1CE